MYSEAMPAAFGPWWVENNEHGRGSDSRMSVLCGVIGLQMLHPGHLLLANLPPGPFAET